MVIAFCRLFSSDLESSSCEMPAPSVCSNGSGAGFVEYSPHASDACHAALLGAHRQRNLVSPDAPESIGTEYAAARFVGRGGRSLNGWQSSTGAPRVLQGDGQVVAPTSLLVQIGGG